MILTIDENSEDLRLDSYLSELYEGISRSKIQTTIKKGKVLVNGEEKKPSYTLKEGDKIEFENLRKHFESRTGKHSTRSCLGR